MNTQNTRSTLEKVLAAEMHKRVFNQLGSVLNEIPTTTLNSDERKEVKLQVLGMIEEACQDFFPEMRRRVEGEEKQAKKDYESIGRRTTSHDRSRDPNFPD